MVCIVSHTTQDFNKTLEKAITEQSAWNMPDPRLRLAVCRVVLQVGV